MFWKYASNLQENTQSYWNRTSAWVFSCKFAAYFRNTFSQEHLWVAASVFNDQCFHNIETSQLIWRADWFLHDGHFDRSKVSESFQTILMFIIRNQNGFYDGLYYSHRFIITLHTITYFWEEILTVTCASNRIVSFTDCFNIILKWFKNQTVLRT